MTRPLSICFVSTLVGLLTLPAQAKLDEQCVMQAVEEGDATSVAEIKRKCTLPDEYEFPEEGYTLDPLKSFSSETDVAPKPRRIIQAHRPNYFTMSYYTDPNDEPFELEDGDNLKRYEAKFQVSFKLPVWSFSDRTKLYFAYTARSWWQVTDQGRSRPFRETNHQPEIFNEWVLDPQYYSLLDDLDYFAVRLGVAHESNGQTIELSRSWNRAYLEFIAKDHSVFKDGDQMYFSFSPWIRFPENQKSSPDDPTGDENPNIERTVGQAEFVLAWRESADAVDSFSVRFRNNFRAKNRSLIELNWGHRLSPYLEIYTQLTSGWGENLLDYNRYSNRIAVGARLTDWF